MEKKYTFRGRAEQIKAERQTILDQRYGDNGALAEHVIMLSVTVEAMLAALAKIVDEE